MFFYDFDLTFSFLDITLLLSRASTYPRRYIDRGKRNHYADGGNSGECGRVVSSYSTCGIRRIVKESLKVPKR